MLAWDDLTDDALEKKLVDFTRLFLARLPPRVFSTVRDESFDTARLNSLEKTPTIESVACFLHENPLVDRARVWRKVISNVRGGAGIDCGIFYDQEIQVAFEAWVEEHGSVPRSYSRIRRLQYRVSVRRFSDQRARAGWCSSCIIVFTRVTNICAVYRSQGFAPTCGQESSSEEDSSGEGGGGGGDDGNGDDVGDGGESGSYERSASDGTGSSPSDRRGPTLRTPNTNPCRSESLSLCCFVALRLY